MSDDDRDEKRDENDRYEEEYEKEEASNYQIIIVSHYLLNYICKDLINIVFGYLRKCDNCYDKFSEFCTECGDHERRDDYERCVNCCDKNDTGHEFCSICDKRNDHQDMKKIDKLFFHEECIEDVVNDYVMRKMK